MGAGQVLVEIPQQELKFTFELKKQSSCPVQLVNNSKDYVAFKVKTTSPKRYCVRPNTGIILPRSTYDFTVTMQAPKEVPPDMQLKDKFLVQSTVVPYGTTEEDIVPSFFSKESGRYIQENKLRVVLVSPPNSAVLEPINRSLRQEAAHEISDSVETCISNNGALQHESVVEVPILEKTSISNYGTVIQETIHEDHMPKEMHILSDQASSGVSGVADNSPSHVAKDIEELKSKVNSLEVKLNEAEKTITSLRKENNTAFLEGEKLQQEIALLRNKSSGRAQAGFPFLFVVFMALVGMVFGHLLHL
ncbi:vesicle-associated protein 1-3 [Canna indica]|uniref:Vesicle-associated protein 1-3 n=1 Tax=Canna indica TaxID=4628 RepID=A0AAQ3KDW0_9LILI|nr:vesicle-associated protein 1-3 [Canna indica]